VFGGLITEQIKFHDRDKYYGNGTMGVWSFNTGEAKYYPWSFQNSYFLLSCSDFIAFGGGGDFAIYMDSDLNKGTSGPCDTFKSPSLSYLRSTNDTSFICVSCELYSLTTSLGSLDGLL